MVLAMTDAALRASCPRKPLAETLGAWQRWGTTETSAVKTEKPMNFPYQQTQALLLEYLRANPTGQYVGVVGGVVALAVSKGQYTAQPGFNPGDGRTMLDRRDRDDVHELVRQLLWQALVKGILVFGMDEHNAHWPFYRLTGYGEHVVENLSPQPYDPTGFMADFNAKNPGAEPVIVDYMTEALRAFNHDCPKAASVMSGAASEKAVLLLCEQFHQAMIDPAKKAQFEKDTERWTISSKYRALKDRLDLMVTAKKLTGDLRDIVSSDLPGCFDLVRRQRNAAGHPELVADHQPDTVFLNLRVMTEYIRRIYLLIDYFRSNAADW